MSADRAFNSGPRGVSRLIGYDGSSTDNPSTDALSEVDLSKSDLSKSDLSKPVDGALESVRAEVAVCA